MSAGPQPLTADVCLDRVLHELDVAEAKAWDSLARYKFQMFGYWAAIWVHLNRIGGFQRPNPWTDLVKVARAVRPLAERLDDPDFEAFLDGPRAAA